MRKILTLTLCLILFSSVLTAATNGKISGRCYKEESGEPLIGANVVVEGTRLGSFTRSRTDTMLF
ncbi:MAG: hypothetical protein U5N26_11225 [Candidatus Marinimicrobia bacterium]|nr:hypothetical protein [Candidatus Neomarinimicrobiota bacterium]